MSLQGTDGLRWPHFVAEHSIETCAPVSVYVYFYIYKLVYNRHKVEGRTSEVPFLPRDGRSHLRYSLHLPAEDGQAELARVA